MLSLEKIEGVIWDMDGVIHPYKPFSQSLAHFNEAAVEALYALLPENPPWRCVALGAANQSFLDWGLSTKQFVDDYNLDPIEMHLEFHRQMKHENLVSQHIEMVKSFEKLSHLKHVILSQGSRDWADTCLAANGLSGFFNQASIICFEDVALAKKSQSLAPFLRAIEASGLKPENLVMIEDMAKNLKLAKELGMQTVFVEENGLEPEWYNLPSPEDRHVDLHVQKTSDFVEMLVPRCAAPI